ncbi:hypothetical protein [Pontivivens nitratireducens]|uniref:Uncharacterized protein n=1 Tax=Pontivivens nitratireducens TaxID=2758038 RepID=A0A6G7VPR2_9RHOB|nr:hypothetical protein [Pontibrevibacter nitratireducens]QIK41848.1 hypothetical protein G8E03_14445 [Pontibrevibacter nitratireducens]
MNKTFVWILIAAALVLFAIGMAIRALFLVIGCAVLLGIAALIWRSLRRTEGRSDTDTSKRR